MTSLCSAIKVHKYGPDNLPEPLKCNYCVNVGLRKDCSLTTVTCAVGEVSKFEMETRKLPRQQPCFKNRTIYGIYASIIIIIKIILYILYIT